MTYEFDHPSNQPLIFDLNSLVPWRRTCPKLLQPVQKSTQVVPLTDVNSFQRQSIAAILEERPLFEEDERIAKAVGHLRESGNYEVFLA